MSQFTSYFVAIPLPQRFQKEFEDFLIKAKNKCPELVTVNPSTPHITIYYLNTLIENALNNVTHRIKKEAIALSGHKLTVNGLGIFDQENAKTLYLNVDHTKAFSELNVSFDEVLKNFSGEDNDWPFLAHLTFGQLPELEQLQSEKALRAMKKLAKAITWEFPINEIIIYGADSTQAPERQTVHTKIVL